MDIWTENSGVCDFRRSRQAQGNTPPKALWVLSKAKQCVPKFLPCILHMVIFGPMFSGKTTELIRRLKRYQIAHYKCLIIRYSKDNRYTSSGISTHDRQELPAVSAESLSSLSSMTSGANVIGIDEGQFFPDCVDFAERMANVGKIVIIAALDGTYQREGFGDILRLVPLAESIVKLKAVCMACFLDASFTKRTSAEKEVEIIGGEDKYMAVCRSCHHSASTLTPKFPLTDISNNLTTCKPLQTNIQSKKDVSISPNGLTMDTESALLQ